MSNRKRKKKINYGKLAFIIIVIVLLLSGLTYGFIKGKNLINKDPIVNPKPSPEPPKKETYTANMIMVGDALIHSSVYKDAHRLANYDGYDFKPQIELIKEKVLGHEIAYYNQETILGGTSLGLSDYPTFNSPQEVGDAMLDAGFNLVSLATNHTVDRGKNAVLSSREYWNTKTNVQAVGSYSSLEEKKELETKVLSVNNITYAMLNYTYGTNGMPVADDYLVNVWPTDTDRINNPETDAKYQAYKETVKRLQSPEPGKTAYAVSY